MSNQERQPGPNENRFDRKGMDFETPHGKAQAKFDEMLETARKYGINVQYSASGESTEPFNDSTNIQKNTTRANAKDTKKPKKPLKVHDTTGLNGFWKGTLYRDGTAQRPKNRRRK